MAGAAREKISRQNALAHAFEQRHQRVLPVVLAEFLERRGKRGLCHDLRLDAGGEALRPGGAVALEGGRALLFLDHRFDVGEGHMHEDSTLYRRSPKLRRVPFRPAERSSMENAAA